MTETVKYLLICLAAAHFLADYVLQRDEEVGRKDHPLILGKHALIQAISSYLLCGLWAEWRIPVVLFLAHGVIDYFKALSVRYKERVGAPGEVPARWQMTVHMLDQAAHFAVIFLLCKTIHPVSFFWADLLGKNYLQALVIVSGGIMAIKAGDILIGVSIKPFMDELRQCEMEKNPGRTTGWIGFRDGGRVIGQLERALILLFILIDQSSGIGFLIAAKSVFRLGEIRERRHGMMAEYIIIGTLMSFGWGLLIACLTRLSLSVI